MAQKAAPVCLSSFSVVSFFPGNFTLSGGETVHSPFGLWPCGKCVGLYLHKTLPWCVLRIPCYFPFKLCCLLDSFLTKENTPDISRTTYCHCRGRIVVTCCRETRWGPRFRPAAVQTGFQPCKWTSARSKSWTGHIVLMTSGYNEGSSFCLHQSWKIKIARVKSAFFSDSDPPSWISQRSISLFCQ